MFKSSDIKFFQRADIFCLLGLASNNLLKLSGSLLLLSGTSPDSLSVSFPLLLLHTSTVNIAMTMAITATAHDVRAIPSDFLSLLLNPPSSVIFGVYLLIVKFLTPIKRD